MLREYPCVVFKDAGSDYGVVVPDLPGCTSAGDDFRDALHQVKEAASMYVEELVQNGDAIPEPSTLEGIAETYRNEEGYLGVSVVPVRIAGKAQRVQLTFDAFLLAEIDDAAASINMTRSAWLADAARQALRGTQAAR